MWNATTEQYETSKQFVYTVTENLPGTAATEEEKAAGYAIRDHIKYDLHREEATVRVTYDPATGAMNATPNPATLKGDFTNEQLKEVAKLDARYAKAMAKKAVERVGNAVDGIIEGLSGDDD